MSREIFCVADTESQAENLMAKIEQMGIEADDVAIATRPSEVEHIAYPNSQLFYDTTRGAFVGSLLGGGYGVATLAVLGRAGIPGLFEALLLIMAGAFGGSLLGMIVGGSGIFGTARMSPSMEHYYEGEVAQGKIVVAVQFRDLDDLDKVVRAINEAGAVDVYYSREFAA